MNAKRAYSEKLIRSIGPNESAFIFTGNKEEQSQGNLIQELVDQTFEKFVEKQEEMFETVQQQISAEMRTIISMEQEFEEIQREHDSIKKSLKDLSGNGIYLNTEQIAGKINQLNDKFLFGEEKHNEMEVEYENVCGINKANQEKLEYCKQKVAEMEETIQEVAKGQ